MRRKTNFIINARMVDSRQGSLRFVAILSKPLRAAEQEVRNIAGPLIALGVVATCFCFFSLGEVITLLVVIRILLQFLLQQAGVIWLRWKRPELARPFRMPLFPLPPLLAMTGFLFVLVYRPHPLRELGAAAAIAATGSVIYLIRARNRREWPFLSRSDSSWR